MRTYTPPAVTCNNSQDHAEDGADQTEDAILWVNFWQTNIYSEAKKKGADETNVHTLRQQGP